MMIYTLDWLRKEAGAIIGHWNGSDLTFVDGNGESRTDTDAAAAAELLEKIREIELIIDELGL